MKLMVAAVTVLIAACLPTSADEPFNPARVYRVQVQPPTLHEQSRAWIDETGKRAVVGILFQRTPDGFGILRADEPRFTVKPSQLSDADRVYALQATEPRVNADAQVLMGKVVKVLDGDTVKLASIGGDAMNIRLAGIDAPEKKQAFCNASIEYLERIKDRVVRVEYIEPDRYGRILGQVYLSDRWVNYEMALAGYAHDYTKYSNDLRLAAAEDYAKKLKRGVWSVPKRITPWDWRNGVREPTEAPINVESIRETDTVVFITKSGSHYHTADCHHAKNAAKIPLSRAVSAYEACKVCKPATSQ